MVLDFVFKHLMKNSNNVNNRRVREQYGLISSYFGMFINFIIFLLEFTIGLISNSASIIMDSLHNGVDSLGSILSLIGFKLSNKPADKEHPFGYGKWENITSLFISEIILFVGIGFIKTGFTRIFYPQNVKFSMITFIIIICAIPLKLLLSCFLYKTSLKIDSDSLLATAKDCRNDLFVLSGIIFSSLISYCLKINIDGYVTFAVAIFITISGIKSILDSINPLIGEAPSVKLVTEINNMVMSYKNILSAHDLIIHNYGAGVNMATIHVVVAKDTDLVSIDKEIDGITRDIKTKLNVDLLIHIDVNDEQDKEFLVGLRFIRKLLRR